MLNRIHQWKPLNFTRKPRKLCPLIISIFTKPSVSAIKIEEKPVPSSVEADPVRQILTDLKKFGLRNFLGENYFGTILSTLNQLHVDRIIDSLRRENLDSALVFFDVLKNEYGYRHSRVSRFVVAHVLASKRRFKDLQIVMKQMVEEEGTDFSVSFGKATV